TYTAESFNGKANRRHATMEALDNLKESAKKIGQGIVAALKAALNTVVNFIVGLLRNRALMEKHLVNLQAQVKKIDSSATRQKDTVSAGAGAFSIGGKADVTTAQKVLDSSNKAIAICAAGADALKSNDPDQVGDALEKA